MRVIVLYFIERQDIPADERSLSCIVSLLALMRIAPNTMLVTIATILLILWLLGLVTSYTIGGFIHILLVIAVVMFLIRIIRGQNPIA